ncbi:hypothetical protein PJP10_10835 [Mycobacterium kansasii]
MRHAEPRHAGRSSSNVSRVYPGLVPRRAGSPVPAHPARVSGGGRRSGRHVRFM